MAHKKERENENENNLIGGIEKMAIKEYDSRKQNMGSDFDTHLRLISNLRIKTSGFNSFEPFLLSVTNTSFSFTFPLYCTLFCPFPRHSWYLLTNSPFLVWQNTFSLMFQWTFCFSFFLCLVKNRKNILGTKQMVRSNFLLFSAGYIVLLNSARIPLVLRLASNARNYGHSN